jgi:hypothetical protein
MYKSQDLVVRVRGNNEKRKKSIEQEKKKANIRSESRTIVNNKGIERGSALDASSFKIVFAKTRKP